MQNADFVSKSNQAALAAGVTSTPTVKINGAAFKGDLYTAGTLKDAVTKAVGSK
jgi:protein-disulfide isomerase